jgi:4'-phosphopantetheinyl transferase
LEFLPVSGPLEPPIGALHVWRLRRSGDALHRVLAVYLGQQPQQIRFERGEHGKPHLADAAIRLEFNLSHSGELALVAVSGEHEVGVDVERVRPKRGESFYRRWARHEAHVKCLGSGLLRARRAPLEPVAVQSVDVGPGYAAAIAARTTELPPLQGWTFGPPRPEAG